MYVLTWPGGDNVQLSNLFQRVHANNRLCGTSGRSRRRYSHRKALAKSASRSGQQRPQSLVRTRRSDASEHLLSYKKLWLQFKMPPERLYLTLRWQLCGCPRVIRNVTVHRASRQVGSQPDIPKFKSVTMRFGVAKITLPLVILYQH